MNSVFYYLFNILCIFPKKGKMETNKADYEFPFTTFENRKEIISNLLSTSISNIFPKCEMLIEFIYKLHSFWSY